MPCTWDITAIWQSNYIDSQGSELATDWSYVTSFLFFVCGGTHATKQPEFNATELLLWFLSSLLVRLEKETRNNQVILRYNLFTCSSKIIKTIMWHCLSCNSMYFFVCGCVSLHGFSEFLDVPFHPRLSDFPVGSG